MAPLCSRRGLLGGAVSLAVLGAVSACSDQNASSRSTRTPGPTGTPTPSGTSSSAPSGGVDAELIARRYPGLKPFPAAPAAPAAKPVILTAASPRIFSRVPVSEKVVFVTIDDGVEKDPAFIQMVKDFRIPLTVCLADTLIKDDYAYFSRLHETGYVTIQNHTLTHPLDMPRLSAARQLEEIAGQQEKLRARYGAMPRIFRPPGGNYNATTVNAVREAGLGGLMLWKESMQIHDLQYQTARHQLNPGDVVLCHFRGPKQLKGATMVQMMAALFAHLQAQGFAVADLNQYV